MGFVCRAGATLPHDRIGRGTPPPYGNGIRIHCVDAGKGPLVLLVHGFPESWYSYRHQLPVLAAGYRAVAIDVRGYGRSSKPAAIDAYRMTQMVLDNVGLVQALGETQAVIVGHDTRLIRRRRTA